MSRSILPLDFPHVSQSILTWICIAFIVAFLLAVVVDYYRRRAHRQMRIRTEWETVEKFIKTREFSKSEEAIIRGLIQRSSPDAPLEVITDRRRFDRCVDEEMRAIRESGNEERYKETGILLREIRVRLDMDYVPYAQRIVSTRELNIGQPIWVTVSLGGASTLVRASVLAIDEAFVHVTVSDEGEKPVPPLAPKTQVRCHLWREDDARYEFKVVVASSGGEPQTWSFYHSADLHRVQDRDYYRVRVSQETSIGVLAQFGPGGTSADAKSRRVVTRIRGRVTNLSAGGLALVTQHAVHTQALLRVAIEIPHEESFDAEVNTVGVTPISGGRYLVRGAFVDLEERRRDAIARYVIQRQRPMLAQRGRSPVDAAGLESGAIAPE